MKELLYLKDEQLKHLIEKLFISYRETFSDSKKILDKYHIGLAHQKTIHLISMYEGISISELMKKLKVSKQSLNRVLKDLIKLEIIFFNKDENDTRIKHIFLNEKGKKIFKEIFEIQKKRIYNALLNSSSQEVLNFDEVLKKMKRRYLSDLYRDRLKQIKSLMPHACVGGDVIVGFPGETDSAFLDTYTFLADLDISYLHVFSYSERPNTEAISLAEVVPPAIRDKRSKMLRGLSAKIRRAFYESQLGATVDVLFENDNKRGYITGFSENYVKVRSPWNPMMANTIQKVSLKSIDEEGFVRFNKTVKV